MESFSELSRRDIAEILRGVRRAKRDREGVVVVTSGELLRDEDLRLGFDPEATDADTRVRIAIAWLERAGLVERNENRTFVFQGRPAVASLEEAERTIRGLGLSAAQGQRWLAILEAMLNTDPDEAFTADELARLPAFVRAAKGRPARPIRFRPGIAATPRRSASCAPCTTWPAPASCATARSSPPSSVTRSRITRP
jgi:ATP-dependent DNA helicase RecQ